MRPCSVRVGDVEISRIVERDGPWRRPGALFPGYDPETAWRHLVTLPPFVYDATSDLLVITYSTFVVRTPHHTILIDTCTGEDKGYPAPMDFPKRPWLDGLHAQGLGVDDIDYVFCTHLHIDHTGWNTRLVNGVWRPTFPNARYIFHRQEYAHWAAADAHGEAHAGQRDVWRMNCLPIVEARQALLVDDDYALDDTFTLIPTPGHSPYHCCVEIRSRGARAIVTGDLMHHVLQVREPGWSTCFDHDPAQAAASRRGFLGSVADTGTLLLPVHFPAPTAGHVVSLRDGYDYRFISGYD